MDSLKSIFDALYNRLLLRDLFGKIVPGSIVLLALITIQLESPITVQPTEIPGAIWILAAGIAWITGIAIQSLSEALHLIGYSPRGVTEKEQIRIRFEFSRIADEQQKQQAERYAIIKDACGQGYVALTFGGLIVIIFHVLDMLQDGVSLLNQFYRNELVNWFTLVLWFLIIFSLRRMHYVHIQRLHIYMTMVLKGHNSK